MKPTHHPFDASNGIGVLGRDRAYIFELAATSRHEVSTLFKENDSVDPHATVTGMDAEIAIFGVVLLFLLAVHCIRVVSDWLSRIFRSRVF